MSHFLLLWALLAAPAVFMLATERDLMVLTASTGTMSARLIILALAITPLVRLFKGAAWARWLQRHRRAIGVAAFAYALLHLLVYLLDMGVTAAAAEVRLPAIWTGWLGFFIMLGLAAISNDAGQRWLGRCWKRWQRLAYFAALMSLIHWLLVHDSQVAALAHALPLLLLQLTRISLSRKNPAHD